MKIACTFCREELSKPMDICPHCRRAQPIHDWIDICGNRLSMVCYVKVVATHMPTRQQAEFLVKQLQTSIDIGAFDVPDEDKP